MCSAVQFHIVQWVCLASELYFCLHLHLCLYLRLYLCLYCAMGLVGQWIAQCICVCALILYLCCTCIWIFAVHCIVRWVCLASELLNESEVETHRLLFHPSRLSDSFRFFPFVFVFFNPLYFYLGSLFFSHFFGLPYIALLCLSNMFHCLDKACTCLYLYLLRLNPMHCFKRDNGEVQRHQYHHAAISEIDKKCVRWCWDHHCAQMAAFNARLQ